MNFDSFSAIQIIDVISRLRSTSTFNSNSYDTVNFPDAISILYTISTTDVGDSVTFYLQESEDSANWDDVNPNKVIGAYPFTLIGSNVEGAVAPMNGLISNKRYIRVRGEVTIGTAIINVILIGYKRIKPNEVIQD